ncbi:hypothetical protein [Phenylobacterium sp.]|uniref:hypothetical protein n=1 Tax=Phenylobacterium sp. TaxID=1871053 RepID=UPI0035633A88
MRRSIRLTGRVQLAVSSFDLQLRDVGDRQVATLVLTDPDIQRNFPPDAAVRLKLVENKRVEILRFGTLGQGKIDVDVPSPRFQAPSCQIRIARNSAPEGLLLGSTTSWTYKAGDVQDGILQFATDDIHPRIWKLDLRPKEFPIVYFDQKLANAITWATSPIFLAFALPEVIREVFRYIFRNTDASRESEDWMKHWIGWSENMIPGTAMPIGDEDAFEDWVIGLVDTFLQKHDIARHAIAELGEGS